MVYKPRMENMESINGKNILVTGGTGFAGSHLVKELLRLGATVIVPIRSLDPRSYFATEQLGKKTVLAICNLKDEGRVLDVVSKYEIDYIFHLAAQAIVTTAYENPSETIISNIVGTTNILEAARRLSRVKGVIVASSDKSYGKSTKPYKETDPLRGDHPYDVSKSSTDLIAQAYSKTYNLPIVVTRFGNIYGEGDLNFSRIIPGIMKSIITKSQLELRSDGSYVRDYVYVKDVVSAYIFLLKNINQTKGQVFNISSNDSYSVISLVKKISQLTKNKFKYSILNVAKNEIPYQHLDDSKIRGLGWKSVYTISRTSKSILNWYKKHYLAF